MGAAISSFLEKVLPPDAQTVAWAAVKAGDEKKLLAVANMKGRNRLHINKRHEKLGGQTLLCSAAELGNRKIVGILLEKLADPNITSDTGFTPLTLALKGGFDGVAQVIINHGDVNLESCDSSSGKTALLWAVEKKVTASTIQLLADKGADLEAKSRTGLTALMIAADQNDDGTVRVLLKAGANPKTQDVKAGTALSRAREKHHTIVVSLLENAIVAKGGSLEKDRSSGGGNSSGSSGGTEANRKSSGNPLARGALGSQVADVFSSGRAVGYEKDTKERTKDMKFAAVSLDSALNSRR